MFKQVKEWIRCGLHISHFKSVRRERLLSVDEEHKPYIRSKRSTNYLPNSWDTQWIRRPKKSWKERSKNKHQYDKVYHTLSEKVNNYELKDQFDEEEFLFLLKNRYKDNWYYFHYTYNEAGKIDLNNLYSVVHNNTWYDAAERLVKQNKLDVQYYTHSWTFDNFGVIETRTKNFITAVKLK
jgi:hypothetical protein